MAINLSTKNRDRSNGFGCKEFFGQIPSLIRQTLLTGILVGLIWLPGFLISPAFAVASGAVLPVNVAPQAVSSTATEGDRIAAVAACLPKKLSQPSLKRALNEMGNDQLERVFNLKVNPRLSQAELDLANCLTHSA